MSADLEAITAEYEELGTPKPLPDETFPVIVDPFNINDEVPTEREIAAAVRKMKSGKAPGASGLRTEDLKRWLRAAERTEDPDPDSWEDVVEIVQEAFISGRLPEACLSVLVLLPKSEPGKAISTRRVKG